MADHHNIDDSNLASEAIAKWEVELNKAKLASNSSGSSEQMDTSMILAAHKLIPAHVNGMVPFGIS